MDLNGISVLVTGATGFVGQYLVQALNKKNAKVKILTTSMNLISSNLYAEDFDFIIGDITRPEMLRGITDDIDVVFHLAAISNVDYAIRNPVKTFDVNICGTLNLLEEVRKNPVQKFVYVSSSHVYGVPHYLPVDEKHPIKPHEPYSASKAAAENIVIAYSHAYSVNVVVLRPFNIYGPGQDERFLIPSVVKQALAGYAVIEVGNIEPTRDFIFITDMVAGLMKIAEFGSGIYNIGSGIEIKVGDIVRKIVEIINPDIEIKSVMDRQRTGNVEIKRMCADISRLKEIGWKPTVGLECGLKKMIRLR